MLNPESLVSLWDLPLSACFSKRFFFERKAEEAKRKKKDGRNGSL